MTYSDPEPDDCRALWVAVLAQGLRESVGIITNNGNDSSFTMAHRRALAEFWLQSRDFDDVADLAGFSAEYLRHRIGQGHVTLSTMAGKKLDRTKSGMQVRQ